MQDLKEAKKDILKALKEGGIYMNNIIGSKLRLLAEEHGTQIVDQLIEEMKLEKLIGIKKAGK